MNKKTKIICTLGPATATKEMITQLALSGMDIARLNFSHDTHASHLERINIIKNVRQELNIPIAILLDTKGPEIRTLLLENDKVTLVKGQEFILTTEDIIGNENRVGVTYVELPNDVVPGGTILIDDGLIELIVKELGKKDILCEVKNGGILSNNKNVNVPGANISMPALTEKDMNDIKFGIENDFDIIAASFIRKPEDVQEMRKVLKNNCGSSMMIIAKIENMQGVQNIDEIIKAADGIMIARGDLGVQLPIEEIPIVQKMITAKCYRTGKPVITATQLLDSMIRNPRPTRAEATDIANAIYDGTSAIMLSGETASGKYPVESVQTMAKIAERAEQSIDYKERFIKKSFVTEMTVTNAISHATCTTAHDLGAAAIITVTTSGNTARMVSKFRPACPIIATTMSEKVQRQLNLSWGVKPLIAKKKCESLELFDHAVEVSVDNKLVHTGDLVVITGGMPLGVTGTTNALKVHTVGNLFA
jgi:pyruvate kinase